MVRTREQRKPGLAQREYQMKSDVRMILVCTAACLFCAMAAYVALDLCRTGGSPTDCDGTLRPFTRPADMMR